MIYAQCARTLHKLSYSAFMNIAICRVISFGIHSTTPFEPFFVPSHGATDVSQSKTHPEPTAGCPAPHRTESNLKYVMENANMRWMTLIHTHTEGEATCNTVTTQYGLTNGWIQYLHTPTSPLALEDTSSRTCTYSHFW